mgnify:FL=1
MGAFLYLYMVSVELLKEINEKIVLVGFFKVEPLHIRYYYEKVYNEKLKEHCSMCLREGYEMLKRYYRGNLDALVENETVNRQKLERNIYELKLRLIECKKLEQYETCEWIKNRIEYLKTQL